MGWIGCCFDPSNDKAKWDDTILKAREQADRYAHAVSKEDGWPPFLIIADVEHVFEIYADFSGIGQG